MRFAKTGLKGSGASRGFTPCNTAQMGHRADDLLPEVKQHLGIQGDERDAEILGNIRRSQSEIELLAGRQFSLRSGELRFDFGGLPFGPIPDLQIATMRASSETCWPIADPSIRSTRPFSRLRERRSHRCKRCPRRKR